MSFAEALWLWPSVTAAGLVALVLLDGAWGPPIV